jgi:hypothetical protein
MEIATLFVVPLPWREIPSRIFSAALRDTHAGR